MNLFDNIIKNTAELQILSILLDTSDIKKFYYRGIAHIWNCWNLYFILKINICPKVLF